MILCMSKTSVSYQTAKSFCPYVSIQYVNFIDLTVCKCVCLNKSHFGWPLTFRFNLLLQPDKQLAGKRGGQGDLLCQNLILLLNVQGTLALLAPLPLTPLLALVQFSFYSKSKVHVSPLYLTSMLPVQCALCLLLFSLFSNNLKVHVLSSKPYDLNIVLIFIVFQLANDNCYN